jgi:hypothetical protein
MGFNLVAPYQPAGDQPGAIRELTDGILDGERHQVLLGVTGSGKTFTVANVINNVRKPTLVLTHNKTLVAQLYGEFRQFFPTMPLNILSLTTITTSPRPTCRPLIPILKRTSISTKSWTSSAQGHHQPAVRQKGHHSSSLGELHLRYG